MRGWKSWKNVCVDMEAINYTFSKRYTKTKQKSKKYLFKKVYQNEIKNKKELFKKFTKQNKNQKRVKTINLYYHTRFFLFSSLYISLNNSMLQDDEIHNYLSDLNSNINAYYQIY